MERVIVSTNKRRRLGRKKEIALPGLCELSFDDSTGMLVLFASAVQGWMVRGPAGAPLVLSLIHI